MPRVRYVVGREQAEAPLSNSNILHHNATICINVSSYSAMKACVYVSCRWVYHSKFHSKHIIGSSTWYDESLFVEKNVVGTAGPCCVGCLLTSTYIREVLILSKHLSCTSCTLAYAHLDANMPKVMTNRLLGSSFCRTKRATYVSSLDCYLHNKQGLASRHNKHYDVLSLSRALRPSLLDECST